jgi:HK97 gp10 family phage protein
MNFELQGVSEVIRNLAKVDKNLPRAVQLRALRMAAEPMRVTATQLCPRSNLTKEHMQDHIIVEPVAATALEEAAVELGPEKRFFYANWIENGTSHSRAQPFMRPAFDQNLDVSMRLLGQLLWIAMTQGLTTNAQPRDASGRFVARGGGGLEAE